MYVMARVLFSIAVLTIATPAQARGDRDDDRKDRRRSSSFGERLGTLFGRENKQGLFCSDRAFDQFAAPITSGA